MGRNGEGEVVIRDCVKRGWSACGAGGGSNQDGKAGEEKNETNYKRKKRKKLLVYTTDLPARVQRFRVPVIANVDGHMRITGR